MNRHLPLAFSALALLFSIGSFLSNVGTANAVQVAGTVQPSAGALVDCTYDTPPHIVQWFNQVNGKKPSVKFTDAGCTINFKFNQDSSYILVTALGADPPNDSFKTAMISAKSGNTVSVNRWGVDESGEYISQGQVYVMVFK